MKKKAIIATVLAVILGSSSDVGMEIKSTINLGLDLCRLACFGANLVDAYSCFIFLPTSILSNVEYNELILAGYQSLSSDILERSRLEIGNGIIGLISKQGRSISISPFEHDSRILGAYKKDQDLKSFFGAPIPLDFITDENLDCCGVLACDSKRPNAFSKLQCKLLEDLAKEIANTIRLSLLQLVKSGNNSNWANFISKADSTISSLGKSSIDVLRVHVNNFTEIEQAIGTQSSIEMFERLSQLIKQTLPAHVPYFLLPTGDMLLILDNMTTNFYQNKIDALSKHIQKQDMAFNFQYTKISYANRKNRDKSLSELIAMTASEADVPIRTQAQSSHRFRLA